MPSKGTCNWTSALNNLPQDALVLGVDVGGTNLRIGVIQGQRIVAEQRFRADFAAICRELKGEAARSTVLKILGDAVAEMQCTHPGTCAAGFGFPGFIDPVKGTVSQSPNLPGLRNVELASSLQVRLGIPVLIENDGLVAAYGEYVLGRSAGGGLVYLGLGTGVGGGLVCKGVPYAGEHGVAMEIGHLVVEPGGRLCGCGNSGCLEQYASASGVAKTYAETSGQHADAEEIAVRAAQGDGAAQAAFALAGDKLGQALASVVNVVDVGQVIVGGGMSVAWNWFAQPMKQRFARDVVPALRGKVRIMPSGSGDRAGLVGAATLALQRYGAECGNARLPEEKP